MTDSDRSPPKTSPCAASPQPPRPSLRDGRMLGERTPSFTHVFPSSPARTPSDSSSKTSTSSTSTGSAATASYSKPQTRATSHLEATDTFYSGLQWLLDSTSAMQREASALDTPLTEDSLRTFNEIDKSNRSTRAKSGKRL
ncbi:hypothetical protein K431DRAFT_290870 [Polychaeton citri CBS 116435]|uniref:Uncharacterized protein n=1 Tax=Polychaeton citri CBS 116435 TaxID=1314669 RepID=A0A9P4QHW1_9PEZI|nr:hypothetical protein K431DRAFT_290870 [Polychaeton citri CBS 116435]